MICAFEELTGQSGEGQTCKMIFQYNVGVLKSLILNSPIFSTCTFLSHMCICFWLLNLLRRPRPLHYVVAIDLKSLLGYLLGISNLICPKWKS